MSQLISWVIRNTHFADTLGIWGHMASFEMPRNQRTALVGPLLVIWAETSILVQTLNWPIKRKLLGELIILCSLHYEEDTWCWHHLTLFLISLILTHLKRRDFQLLVPGQIFFLWCVISELVSKPEWRRERPGVLPIDHITSTIKLQRWPADFGRRFL